MVVGDYVEGVASPRGNLWGKLAKAAKSCRPPAFDQGRPRVGADFNALSPLASEAPPMTENPPERRIADLDALRRQLEEMASRRNGSERMTEDRRLSGQAPTLVIRGK
jgi:hypothetical protein